MTVPQTIAARIQAVIIELRMPGGRVSELNARNVLLADVLDEALAALPVLVERPHVQEQKEDTRVVDTQYDPPTARPLATASENESGPSK